MNRPRRPTISPLVPSQVSLRCCSSSAGSRPTRPTAPGAPSSSPTRSARCSMSLLGNLRASLYIQNGGNVLWGNNLRVSLSRCQTEKDILLREELQEAKKSHPDRLELWFTLDKPPQGEKRLVHAHSRVRPDITSVAQDEVQQTVS